MSGIVGSIASEFRRYKALAEGALGQLDDGQLSQPGPADGHSVAVLVWHIAGNLKSRFTDFLTTDGEKPWRDRDSEFAPRTVTRAELLGKWEDGWGALFAALDGVSEGRLHDSVSIRGRALSVHEALHRALAHISYHVGQIVYLAKSLRGDAWTFLSIPPGQSAPYNRHPTMERGPGHATVFRGPKE